MFVVIMLLVLSASFSSIGLLAREMCMFDEPDIDQILFFIIGSSMILILTILVLSLFYMLF